MLLFGFAAFSPSLAIPLTPGKPVTVWFVYGLALIAGSVALGAIYVFAANRADRARVLAWGVGLGLLATLRTPPRRSRRAPTRWRPGCSWASWIRTLGVTWWSARRTRSAKGFYAAGGNPTGLQNGLAIAARAGRPRRVARLWPAIHRDDARRQAHAAV